MSEKQALVAQLDAQPTGDQEVSGTTPAVSNTGTWFMDVFFLFFFLIKTNYMK